MVGQPGFSDMDDRLKRSSDPDDQLEACAGAFRDFPCGSCEGSGVLGRVPDAKTIWASRERLSKAGVIEGLFSRLDAALREDGYIAPPDIAIPSFGYKAHSGIDKRFRFIRRWDVTSAAAPSLPDHRMYPPRIPSAPTGCSRSRHSCPDR